MIPRNPFTPERERGWIEFTLVTPLIIVGYFARAAWYGLLTGWCLHRGKWW